MSPDGVLAEKVGFEPTVRSRVQRFSSPRAGTQSGGGRLLAASGEVIAETETSFVVRWACRQEMAYLFELSGFEVVEQYSDFDRAPPVYWKRQIWVVRRR